MSETEALTGIRQLPKFTVGQIGKCGACKFSDVFKGQDGKVDFNMKFCKYEPPKLLTLPAANGIQIVSQYPMVGTNDKGCSKFVPMLDS
jgi:hypothetical protein